MKKFCLTFFSLLYFLVSFTCPGPCCCFLFCPPFSQDSLCPCKREGNCCFCHRTKQPSPLPSSDVLPFPLFVKLYLTRLTVSLLFFSLSSPHLSSAHMKAHMKSFCGLLTCVSALGTNTCLSKMLCSLSFLPLPLPFFLFFIILFLL